MKNFLKNKKGISPIISTILIFSILMTGVLFTYSWGLPLVLQFQDKSEVNDITNQFYELDRNIKIVTHEGDGATRSTQFEFNRGFLDYTSSSNFSLILRTNTTSTDPIAVLDVKRMTYVIRSSMDDLSLNSSSPLTGAVDAYPILNVTNSAADVGINSAFNEDDQNNDITRIVYTRPESSRYSVYLEYRPIVKLRGSPSGDDVGRLDITIHTIELVNAGSFPAVGSPKIIVKRIERRIDFASDLPDIPSLNAIQGKSQVYLYALVDGTYQQLTSDFSTSGSFSLEIHIVNTQIQIYNM